MPRFDAAEFRARTDVLRGRIEPRLFGHNLEHTRSCMYQGLSAQILRNRKFGGKPHQLTGQAMEWYAIGPRETLFVLGGPGTHHTEAASYTRHAAQDSRDRWNEVQCQRIQGHRPGAASGIGQDRLPLRKDRCYTGRLVLMVSRRLDVRVSFLSEDRQCTFHDALLDMRPDGWSTHEFAFTPDRTDLAARMEITFEGPGSLLIGAVSLLPQDNFHGMRRDVVDLLRRIGASVLRWPGGNFAGDYRWQDGLLDVDERAPLAAFLPTETLPHTMGFDTHEIATDEFIALCREVGADPFVSINLGWEGPEEAAAWVEYCNGAADTTWGSVRSARGHAEPYGVRLWSLGNEMGYGHMEGPNAAEAYAAKAVACAEAMKRADPTIELVSSGAWWRPEWFTEVVPRLAPYIDHVSYHEYHAPMLEYLGEAGQAGFLALVDEPMRSMQRLRELRAKIEAVLPGSARTGISFDEWNAWYAWYRTPGVAEGVYAASMLDALCRNASEAGISVGCFFQPVNEGAIVVGPLDARLTPGGMAFDVYKGHAGSDLVQVDRLLGDGRVDLTVSRQGRALFATLVNRSPSADCRVQIEFDGICRLEVVEARRLIAADFLPGSTYRDEAMSDVLSQGNVVTATVPRYGIVGLRLASA